MTTYYYISPFSNTSDSNNNRYGLPDIINPQSPGYLNPYNSTTSTTLLFDTGTLKNNLETPFLPDDADNISKGSFTSGNIIADIGDGAILFLGGGEATFNNAIGVAVSPIATALPNTLTTRFILIPNMHTSIFPFIVPPNPKQNAGGFAVPIPTQLTVSPGQIIGSDAVGTPILDQSLLSYLNASGSQIFYYPFILQNAWKYDIASTSWYADTSSQIWWGPALANSDVENHILSIPITSFPPTLQADLIDAPPTIDSSEGFEDLDRSTITPLNQDINDAVYTLRTVTFTPT